MSPACWSAWLAGRGRGYAAALCDPAVVRVAVNPDDAEPGQPVSATDEIALFPPVTGG